MVLLKSEFAPIFIQSPSASWIKPF